MFKKTLKLKCKVPHPGIYHETDFTTGFVKNDQEKAGCTRKIIGDELSKPVKQQTVKSYFDLVQEGDRNDSDSHRPGI